MSNESLTQEQQQRAEALRVARDVLSNRSGFSSTIDGAPGSLIVLAQWVIDGKTPAVVTLYESESSVEGNDDDAGQLVPETKDEEPFDRTRDYDEPANQPTPQYEDRAYVIPEREGEEKP